MTFRDINGNELRDGDKIRLSSGMVYTLEEREYPDGCGIKGSYFGGRTRLCMGDSVSEPTPDYVKREGIIKI
jgi:hypothetical protein